MADLPSLIYVSPDSTLLHLVRFAFKLCSLGPRRTLNRCNRAGRCFMPSYIEVVWVVGKIGLIDVDDVIVT